VEGKGSQGTRGTEGKVESRVTTFTPKKNGLIIGKGRNVEVRSTVKFRGTRGELNFLLGRTDWTVFPPKARRIGNGYSKNHA